MNNPKKMSFQVSSKRIDAHGSQAYCKEGEITLDTDLHGRADAFNPAELLLAALAACMIKGIERVTPILKFEWQSGSVNISWLRQDVPPRRACPRIETVARESPFESVFLFI